MARARGDLALAGVPLPPGGFYEDLCFHAQQAAEKAIKAVYLQRGWGFRYVHDLEELLVGLENRGVPIPAEVKQAVSLTSHAWESRYAGKLQPVTEAEYREALALAESVIAWATSLVEGSSP